MSAEVMRSNESLDEIDSLIDETTLAADLRDRPQETLSILKHAISTINEGVKAHYQHGTDVEAVVYGRADLIRRFLAVLFDHLFADAAEPIALIAVGGFGRGELHPGSDVDLMILLAETESDTLKERIERFVMMLWDSKLEVGQSVRTIEECIDETTRDITVATNIMESNFIAGDVTLYDEMKVSTGPDRVWDSSSFFQAKLDEQVKRSGKFNDTAFNLEPNIKESSGGLRDIQMIGWVAKRHFGADNLKGLVDHGFLMPREYDALRSGQRLLWRIRCSLHYLAGRREDRLLFDYQRDLALEFGFEDDDIHPNYAIEQFMQQYYRTVMQLERLNEMLLQLFREAILHADETDEVTPLNDQFQIRHGYIEATNERVFEQRPSALLELFVLIQQHPEIQGVRAETIRLVRDHRHLIDEAFRHDEENSRIFINILRQNRGITSELRRMNRYGILEEYIPAFGHIVGRMQYDLFHAYTVDQHTLFVVRNLRRFAVPDFCHEFPLASGIIHHIKHPELLYIAGLFHDIAKGRNGDHSELGCIDAYDFCMQHGIHEKGAELVSWLVKSHLKMSMTAQSKDISDPDVISEFAHYVGDIKHLDHLYLLTVADIRGTNPKQWNSWKDKLLVELYNKTAHVLHIGYEQQLDRQETILQNQTDALRALETKGFDPADIHNIWQHCDDEYFLRQTADETAWQTETLARNIGQVPLVRTRVNTDTSTLELMVFTYSVDMLFAALVTQLSQMRLNIADAHVIDCDNEYSIEVFKLHFTEEEFSHIEHTAHEIETALSALLGREIIEIPNVNWTLTRTEKHFSIPTTIEFEDIVEAGVTRMQIEAQNQQGLLAMIASVFIECGISIHRSRISTVGEKALDYFDIRKRHDAGMLDDETKEQLKQKLIERIG